MQSAAASCRDRDDRAVTGGDGLFDAIGAFLDEHGLSPDPAHYAFAHAAITDPTLADSVARLTDGGVRLGRREIETLGWTASARRPITSRDRGEEDRRAAALVTATRAQLDGFAELMRSMRHETNGFGRDLAESAAEIARQPRIAGLDEITRIAGAMTARVRDAERRLANATAEAEGLRRKLAAAQDEARRDPLTGLANRLAFEEAYAQAVAAGEAVCLAVCDVDHFKQLNDRHGHGVGDRVLSAIGQGLVTACEGHLVARHGGEEFAVLLSGLTAAAAADLLETARLRLSERRFRDRDTGATLGRITMSVGIVVRSPDEPLEAVFERADRLLYAAKAHGRDRVIAG